MPTKKTSIQKDVDFIRLKVEQGLSTDEIYNQYFRGKKTYNYVKEKVIEYKKGEHI